MILALTGPVQLRGCTRGFRWPLTGIEVWSAGHELVIALSEDTVRQIVLHHLTSYAVQRAVAQDFDGHAPERKPLAPITPELRAARKAQRRARAKLP